MALGKGIVTIDRVNEVIGIGVVQGPGVKEVIPEVQLIKMDQLKIDLIPYRGNQQSLHHQGWIVTSLRLRLNYSRQEINTTLPMAIHHLRVLIWTILSIREAIKGYHLDHHLVLPLQVTGSEVTGRLISLNHLML